MLAGKDQELDAEHAGCQAACLTMRRSVSPAKPGLFIKTFGCQMNEYDSEKIALGLSPDYELVQSVEAADVVIINTCSVRDKAEQKLYSYLGTLSPRKKEKPGLVIGVTGCVAQQEKERILKRNRLVDFVAGTHNLAAIADLVRQARNGGSRQVAADFKNSWEIPSIVAQQSAEGPCRESHGGLKVPEQYRALVAIQRGCDKRCTFCVVPQTRGKQLSRPAEEIEEEIRAKVSLGAKEVLLLGQTVNSYGKDAGGGLSFEDLIRRIALIGGVERIRFTSPHPAEMSRSVIALYGEIPQLCPHVHLPLQSGSDAILKLMKRGHTAERYRSVVEGLRKVCPAVAITTDIIVGFPTESEDDFEKTMEMVKYVRYQSSYSFKYSPRPGTAAVTAFSPEQHVSADQAQDRLARLQHLQDSISQEINSEIIGKTVEVLVEGADKKISSLVRGRTPQNVLVEVAGAQPEAGEIVQVRITYASAHGLRGEICIPPPA